MWAANAHVGYLFLPTTCSKKKGKEETEREGGKIQTWDGNSNPFIQSNAPTRAHDQDPVRGLSPLCLIAARMMRWDHWDGMDIGQGVETRLESSSYVH